MSISRRYTIADLEQMTPAETERYELIDGELYVSHAPSWQHQFAASCLNTALQVWSQETGAGTTLQAPGIIFSAESGVIPDVVWISWERLRAAQDRAGHFTLAPELVIEVVSPGSENARRDRQTKLSLYSREAVQEYWIVDLARQSVQVYRYTAGELALAQTATGDDAIQSPLLPGFELAVARIWPPAL